MAIAVVGIALRAFQILFAVVALGLSVNLIKGQKEGNAPAPYGLAAFAGAISLVGGLLGIAGTWIELLQGALMFGIDGLLALINLAAGVLLAIKLKGANCSKGDNDYRYDVLDKNYLFNGGGCFKDDNGNRLCAYSRTASYGKLSERCRQATADSAFMLMTIIVLLAATVIVWLRLKNHK
ncbi:marvel domain-containing protein [Lophiotrema nucula]|uniref:Marvel domain-containing protein n=1 Tax=Lophiotrema nucula TaxID=690887 RepID=A0A6A5YSH8_9PLEO|nr:marvel domain-containing protein [Lophiotrema nucula]